MLSKEQREHFREWIETSMPSFAVLPTLEFLYSDPTSSNTLYTVSCSRREVSPFEMVEDLKSGPRVRFRTAIDHIVDAYAFCVSQAPITSSPDLYYSLTFKPTTAFKVAYNLKRKWLTRHISSDGSTETVKRFFSTLCHGANGKDWGKDQLNSIADFVGNIERSREPNEAQGQGQDASRRGHVVFDWRQR